MILWQRWARAVIRLRWVVLAVWVVAFLAAGAASSGLWDLLTNRFALPGAESWKADQILEGDFGQLSSGLFSLVAPTGSGRAEGVVRRLRDAAARVSAVSDSVSVATIVSKLGPADAKGDTDEMRKAAGTDTGRRSTSPASRPSSTTSSRSSEPRSAGRRGLHRDPDCDADPDLRLRLARLPAAC